MEKTPHLIIISAPSGAGKTTLCKRLLAEFPRNLRLSISATTRSPRGNEREGVEYFFLDRETFLRRIEDGEFAEWATVHGNYYGTPMDFVEKNLSKGVSVLLDIDVQGAESLAKRFPGRNIRIFIVPPDLQTLEGRLRARRTEDEAAIEKRMKTARLEMGYAEKFDHVVVNDELESALSELQEILRSRIGGG